MPRTRRTSVGGLCYHVLNRGNRKSPVFHEAVDYRSFLDRMARATTRVSMRNLGWCLMPNHIHLVLWPREDADLSRFMHWLLTTYSHRYHRRYGTSGRLWQGRFKAFPIQQDDHLWKVLRYVERNPLRANLVARAEDWPWSSLHDWSAGRTSALRHPGPVGRMAQWTRFVNEPHTDAELEALRTSAQRQAPFGDDEWVRLTAARLDLGWTLRKRGGQRLPHMG